MGEGSHPLDEVIVVGPGGGRRSLTGSWPKRSTPRMAWLGELALRALDATDPRVRSSP